MKTTRFLYTLICALCAVAFTACDKDAHEGEYPLGDRQGAFIVGLTSDAAVSSLSIYFFDADGTSVIRKDYTDPRDLAREYIPVDAGSYTVVVVANVPDDNLPAESTVADLAEWLNEQAAGYPDMLTASAQEEVAAGEVKRLSLALQEGTAGIGLSDLTLRLTIPGKEMPAYTTRATSDDSHSLRLVAEVYRQGTETRIHRRVQLCEEQVDGTYTASLSLMSGDYDLRLWADWTTDGTTADNYYNADDLSAVTVLTTDYVANGQTDEKDACYAVQSLTLSGDAEEQAVELIRPLARYRIIANDVEGYRNLIAKGEDLPPIEDLEVSVIYEGFFPTGFNVSSGKPNDALTGISYRAGIIEAEGYSPDEARQVGADFVLTGDDSFVTVTVQMTDRTTGEAVSTVTGVEIPYRCGHLTTVTGTFLTAGRTSGGVEIDTGWGDPIIVPF